MKLFLFLIACIAAQKVWSQDPAYPTTPAAPQNIVTAEYFFDTDPGFGNAASITITPGVTLSNVAATVNTSGLSNGIHRFCLRTRSTDGGWGLTNVIDFLVDFNPAYSTSSTIQTITRAEYFIDADPGFGSGTPIPVATAIDLPNVAATINTAGLSNGVHRLWLRTQGADGKWSISNVKDFLVDFDPAYPTNPATPQNLMQAEYFFDTDPGFGSGSAIAITPSVDLSNVAASVNTTGLSIGIHRMYLRTKSGEGRWSITNQKDFLVDENPAYPTAPAAPGNLVYGEYFFDTDPGRGNGTPITFTPGVTLSNITISVTTSSLPDGNHTFFMRTLDDWSLTGYQTFLKGNPLPLRLLSFYAKNNDRSVTLEWKTDNEINTVYFDVERSADGIHFSKIGTVSATNQSGIQTYTLNDVQPIEGKGFYRLKQVDKDAKYEYTKIVAVNRSKALELQVFPNPAQTAITVLLPLQTGVQLVTLVDAKAQVIKNINVPAGNNSTEISLAGLPSGTYFIKWQSGDKVRVKPFVKM